MKKLIVLILIILIIGGFIIKSNYNLNIKDPEDRKTFTALFSRWLFKLGRNIASLTSSAIKKNWSPLEKQNKNDTKTTN